MQRLNLFRLVVSVLIVLLASVILYGATQTATLNSDRLDYIERRLNVIEGQNLAIQVAVMRSQLDSIVKLLWWVLGLAAANMLQLASQLLPLLSRRRNDDT